MSLGHFLVPFRLQISKQKFLSIHAAISQLIWVHVHLLGNDCCMEKKKIQKDLLTSVRKLLGVAQI